MSYHQNNPYRHSPGSGGLKKLQKRPSVAFLEKVGVFLPNTSEIDIHALKNVKKIESQHNFTSNFPSVSRRSDNSPNRISLKPLRASDKKGLTGLTFESSIRSRVDIARESIMEKDRAQSSQIWKEMQRKHEKKPLLTFDDELKISRAFPMKTKSEMKKDGMKSVYWSPAFNTEHVIPGLTAKDNSGMKWVDTYGKETNFFASRSKWASVKLLEVTQMSNAARGPSR
eukprot:g10054.t1